ncbi:hypothetical protein RI129_005974 [Pyrocoelia pectoralis]|uniref:Calmodulin-lysine N-methyltransferase n=1 Tax=Pyrocoelia pectoralis TaxID=417401 RepID=A0AAN7VJC9_9COLE
MDQHKKFDILHSNGTIDINDVLSTNKNEKKKAARKRWAILAKALKSPSGSEPSSPTDEFSVRRISSFMLLTTQLLEHFQLNSADYCITDQIRKRTWYKYSMKINDGEYFVNISHRIRTFSAEDLMGFNNTGNICVWPSEETLTYFIGANLRIVDGKSVLELGGGMSCLAGLICAKYGAAKQVTLTDGNKISIENVQTSLYNNEFTCPVVCNVLKWEECIVDKTFDVILCADCLFFDEGRIHLIKCLWDLMSSNSLALIMAPRRGNTLAKFISQAQEKGFTCREVLKYNNVVWEKHLALLDNCEYDENIHYPILIEVTKTQVALDS